LAHELVFSLWVRRRDAHSFNRIYQHGVPIFFDSGTAFLGEPDLVDLDRFFRTGPDPGYAGLWAIGSASYSDLDTLKLREREKRSFLARSSPKVVFPVIDNKRFYRGLEDARDAIARIPHSEIKETIQIAGFTGREGQNVLAFLTSAQAQLEQGCDRLNALLAVHD
jgi:hypothetical protein